MGITEINCKLSDSWIGVGGIRFERCMRRRRSTTERAALGRWTSLDGRRLSTATLRD